jgi:hypothetical protein
VVPEECNTHDGGLKVSSPYLAPHRRHLRQYTFHPASRPRYSLTLNPRHRGQAIRYFYEAPALVKFTVADHEADRYARCIEFNALHVIESQSPN